ncbi:MAG: GWxTD domain-containing protein [Gemmatimonadota bacterium]|nr:GWxTD domain-containing protein [Gemmatimonadota bacterium]
MGPLLRRAALAPTLVTVAATAACQWQRVGSDTRPDPSVVVPQLFNPAALYTRMGFFAAGPPLPFVASLQYLATSSPDTTLALFGLSMANSALSFRQAGQALEARYQAEVVLRRAGSVLARAVSEETVRVASRDEARRADESVIFQQFLQVPPGAYDAVVTVRDEYGTSVGRAERQIGVPRVGPRGLSDVVAVYRVEPRGARTEAPRVLLNPRATVPFGLDTLRLYLEGYGYPAGTPVAVRVTVDGGREVWSGEVALAGTPQLGAAVVTLSPDQLPVGELRAVARVEATQDSSRVAAALVSFSEQWAITNFDEVLSLLRYFGQDRAIGEMRAADPVERPALWRTFWRATDPNPLTPQNEALELYFRRVQEANARFRETGDAGWLTDRGEVFITLGEPDEIFDSSSDLQGTRRIVRWNYLGQRLTLDFVDDTGFGRFRLTPTSRAEYQRVLNSIRSRN